MNEGAKDVWTPGSREERAPVLQWVGFFLAPAVFLAHLQLAYLLVPWACATHQEGWLRVTSLVAVGLSAAGTAAAWVTWMRAGREVPGEGAGSLPRTRFLGATGLGMNAVLTLILLLQWVAEYFITACQ
jgi:hypothetical protein